jgi:hypothetical protein
VAAAAGWHASGCLAGAVRPEGVNRLVPAYPEIVIGDFTHKGLQELHANGKTRRIGPVDVKGCIRVLRLLDLATQPEESCVYR